MDLGNQRTPIGQSDGRSVTELLGDLRNENKARRASELREWVAITAWADANVVDCPEHAATLIAGVIDTGIPLAGPGAPLVSEFQLMELIAVLERSPESGRIYVGKIIEIAWRLPKLYELVMAGRVAPWRALRIAEFTRALGPEAAAYVDTQVAAVAGGVGWAQLERLVQEAVIRFDPEAAGVRRDDAGDDRYVDTGETDANGLREIHALLDAADGHDLDEAINRRAKQMGRLGSEQSLDIRRSIALGEIARNDLALDLLIADEETGEVIATVPGRKVVLNLHLAEAALFGNGTSTADGAVGRWEEGNCPITTNQIREWLSVEGTTITIRPVIDLADCVPVDSWEIPDRLKVRVRLRDHQCRFPNCPTKAIRCDLDHRVPHDQGGPTCPCNLAPLCRKHHRAKTFSTWRYVSITPGHYLWISPHGRHFHVGPHGTTTLDPPRSPDPDP